MNFKFINFEHLKLLGLFITFLFLILLVFSILSSTVPVWPKEAIMVIVFILGLYFFILHNYIIDTENLKDRILIQHSQLNTIINNTPFVICLIELDGRLVTVNDEFARIVGVDKEKLINLNVKTFCNQEMLSVMKEEDDTVVETKQPVIVDRNMYLNGTSGWYRIMKYPVFDKDGNVVRLVIVNKNIDDEKEIENKKNSFVATLTHDLKTPTIAQIKALDLLLRETLGDLTSVQKEIITQIKNSCNYMYNLIFTILDTYLYDNGNIKLNIRDFDINNLVNSTYLEISNLSKERNQQIKIKSNLKSNIISADDFQIKRVIVNLLTNAIVYGYNNSQILVTISENESDIILEVINHSNYIPQEQLKDIFEKYKSSKAHKYGKNGTGLGLYLSKQIIEAHSGSVFAYSDENNICKFSFFIPKVQQKIFIK